MAGLGLFGLMTIRPPRIRSSDQSIVAPSSFSTSAAGTAMASSCSCCSESSASAHEFVNDFAPTAFALEPFVQRASFDQRHHEEYVIVVDADVKDRHDRWMAELRHCSRFC